MTYGELNAFLKDIVRQLIKRYPKSHVLTLTFGHSSPTTFKQFVEDDDRIVGIKPLLRMLNNLGYDLMVIPVPKNDNELKRQLRECCDEVFTKQIYDIMSSAIEEIVGLQRTKKHESSEAIDQVVKSILETI